ncbi:PP-loop ATPase superfamily protein [Spraguea lophii 42_110]|uniref:PP-loop ATPase superfamily protein n=1 Tax=Spraguea lophii (strain 42_110) TaxID=1358809 RepID=S7W668_SPRLO|nr:PP-loop ATPase superfamily protein [Spraguea lophii 42_110]
MSCFNCKTNKAIILRSRNREKVCKICFYYLFEEEVHDYVSKLFKPGDRIGIAVSGGKDSTVMCHVIYTLNKRYNYGIELFLLSVDEGIKGYRDFSLEIVEENRKDYNLSLKIISFKELVGETMDEMVKKIGLKNNCTACGILRRTGLEIMCKKLNINKLLMGHNADDMAETTILNLIRGDYKRLVQNKKVYVDSVKLQRIHPFRYSYQKEIILYAFHQKLKYFSVECTHSKGSHRGYVRDFLKDMEKVNPGVVLNIIKATEQLSTNIPVETFNCIFCNAETISKNKICQLCELAKKLQSLPIKE